MINIGLIGFGYWGPNLARNIAQNNNLLLHSICDINHRQLEYAKHLYPFVHLTTNPDDVICNTHIDAVVIATPVNQHFSLIKKSLENNKHVLAEKPLTDNISDAEYLIRLAEKNKRILMVDHVFIYNGVVRKIKELIDNSSLGNIQYIDSTRINLGIFQHDVNVLWDLATHDISIVNFLIKEKPFSVIATGKCHTGNNVENIAFITLNYKSDLIIHINCSWSSPVKIRQMLIGGTKKMLLYNDIEPTEKLKVYDKSFIPLPEEEKHKILTDYRTGDVFIPKYDTTEPLKLVVEDFYNSIISGKQPLSDGKQAMEIVSIVAAANESLKNNGKEIIIN